MVPAPSWSLRYGRASGRLCARPGCGAVAAATLRFQPTQRAAWLVDLVESGARTEGDLCARHARNLVLPRGWVLHDERTVAGAAPAEADVPEARPRPRRRRARTDPAPALPGLAPATGPEPASEDAPAAAAATEPEPAPEDAPAAVQADSTERADGAPTGPETVVGGQAAVASGPDEDLDEVLDAQSPLLRRAFRNAWPR